MGAVSLGDSVTEWEEEIGILKGIRELRGRGGGGGFGWQKVWWERRKQEKKRRKEREREWGLFL